MTIYKPSLLDKFKDFVNGVKANWDDYETHKADYETHKADYETHKAESASKHITESGSNENGYYIKFDDGTMICWGMVVANNVTATVPMTYGGYRSPGILLTFPATFHPSGGVPVVSHYASNLNVMGKVNYASTNFSSAHFIVQTIQAMNTGIELVICFSVVGRWKDYD